MTTYIIAQLINFNTVKHTCSITYIQHFTNWQEFESEVFRYGLGA